jgi:ClpP class serine protease
VLAFFTSFFCPVVIQDNDADMIEEVLRNTDMDGRELVLLLNSPGGDGLAAERIVNICRSYSSGSFSVVVPKMAKSAATMICFGAKSILMSQTSELGPVDPQVPIRDDSGKVVDYQAAHEVIEAYNDLMRKANTTQGKVEPYLQQLARIRCAGHSQDRICPDAL